ncbi:MAG: MepB family protein [Bdellovibrionales bacterium]|nr:MepB family protein [Bdellovibrionales bacterium]
MNIIHPDLHFIIEHVYKKFDHKFTNFQNEAESSEYGACTYTLNNELIKFRVAKITPTKVGQFVTFWKRNSIGETTPHTSSDLFDLAIISVRKEKLLGHFIFPKSALISHGLISHLTQTGKRGFRVYPSWDRPINTQGIKTQKWQLDYFYDVDNLSAFLEHFK